MTEDPRISRRAALGIAMARVRRRFATEGGGTALVEALVRVGADLFECACSLRLLSTDDHLVFTAAATFGSDAREGPQPIELQHPLRVGADNVSTHVVRTATPVVLSPDDTRGLAGAGAVYQDTIRALGMHSMIVVPVMAQARILGVLYFAASGSTPRLGTDELEPAVAVADELGLMLSTILDLEGARRLGAHAAAGLPFRNVLEAMPDAVIVTDGGRIVMQNAQARQLFGYANESLIGRTIEVLLPASRRDDHVGHRDAYADTPRARPMGTGKTLVGLRANGTEVPVEVMLSPCDIDGRPHIVAVVREVAQRRAREIAAEQDLADRHLLFELGEFARMTDDPRDLAAEVTRRVADHIGVPYCIVTENDRARSLSRIIAVRQTVPDASPTGEIPRDGYSPTTVAELETGRLVAVIDMTTDPRTAAHADAYRRTSSAAWVAVPLMRAGMWVGTFVVKNQVPRAWTQRELALLQRIAERLQQWFASMDMVQTLRDLGQSLELRVETRTAELRESVREKDVLLREVHHRVKNNLQVISSILKLQAFQHADDAVKASFRACQARVHAIALVHEKLYSLPNLARVAFDEYARTLIERLAGANDATTRGIVVDASLEPVEVSIEHAIPAGLVLNELLTNAFKHAFPGDRRGRIGVHLSRSGASIRLEVRDDGVGLGDLDPARAPSFGLDLVYTFAEQLGAEIVVERTGGAAFTLDFRGANE